MIIRLLTFVKAKSPIQTVGILFLAFGFSFTHYILNTQPVQAQSASEWKAGNIIDDSVFYDKSSMTIVEIQNFLNSKNPQCDTWGTKTSEYGGGTRAQYGASKGYPAPFVCLKDYWENPTTKVNNLHNTSMPSKPIGARSAAEIIWDVSQQFNISPKVMLVMLHKESDRLLIDDWPWALQYRAAMGYGCPDSGPNYSANCNPNDYGFYTQMYNAARQFRIYANSPQNYRYKAGQNNAIQYNPNPACGSSTVYIENQATASLYNYTPYQPNQAALNAGYGEAPCGAYGNRNFWRLFHDWFGSTRGGCTYPGGGATQIYRIFQPNRNNYLLTNDAAEVCAATARYGYVYDTVLAYNNGSGSMPVYRLSRNGSYLYTTSTNERDNAVRIYGYTYEGVAFNAAAASANSLPIYRLRYPETDGMAYTASSAERDLLVSTMGFKNEGIGFYMINTAGEGVYDTFRLAHPVGGYLYTVSSVERITAVNSYGYRDEGVGFRTRAAYAADNLPVYRLAATKGYLYTTSLAERKYAISHGYRPEGVSYFAYPNSNYGASKTVYRLSHPNGTYLYSIHPVERDAAVRNFGYRLEGAGFRIP